MDGLPTPKPEDWLTPWQRRGRHAAEFVAAVLFAVMFAAFLIQIFFRYVIDHPVPWSLELCSLSYLWVIFWSAGLIVSERQHIVFDLVYQAFPMHMRRWLAIFITGSIAVLFIIGLPGSYDFVSFMGRRHTLMLHVPFDIAYSCFLIFMVAAIAGSLVRLWRLFGAHWEAHL